MKAFNCNKVLFEIFIKQITFIFLITVLYTTVESQPVNILWSENWEGTWTKDWHVDGGTWEVGTPASGPDSALNGNNCAATVLNGNYSEPVATRLIRHSSFVVPDAAENPRLRFWYWFSFNSPGDWGQVQIKVGDSDWEFISNKMDYQGGDAWSKGSVDLSKFAGSTVQLAFYFQSVNDGSSTPDVSSGWYIDDVSLITGLYTFNNPEDFESGFGDWSVDEGTWEHGVPASGPANAHSGNHCFGTNIDGNFQERSDSRLISPPFIVPAAKENPRFRFWYWFSFNSLNDWGDVQIRVGDGEWESITGRMDYKGGDAWSYGSVDISQYADSRVQLAFSFHSINDGSSNPDVSSGWYIDDISLITGPYVYHNPDDFESGFGDWSVDEGTWEVGVPTIGPDSAHSGKICAGTNLDGNFQERSDSRLVSPPFVVPAAKESPSFQFWHWFSFSSPGDRGEVQISQDNGTNWETVSSQFSNTSSGAWTPYYIPLSPYAGKRIKVAFNFHSINDGSSTPDVSSGWYIDDVTFPAFAPTVKTHFSDTSVVVNTGPHLINTDLNQIFSDVDPGDSLIFEALSTTGIIQAIVSGDSLILTTTIDSIGEGDVIVTAVDRYFLQVSDTFHVMVTPASGIAEAELNRPDSYLLYQNYPNPFNPVTTIRYKLPISSEVFLHIYNSLGQKITTLVSAHQPAGDYKVNWNAANYASGVYFYKLETLGFVKINKMLLVK